ncbi:unnamed protein product [Angiostrongylus costaricensis]|uniref:XRN2-binding (XTBD) domain-containing protein n=1 Tax=Angiostrongylus costaricensis TaxID=334426 RepID=A0A0R3PZY7_ANGCS|nr:unnamed protein product [Angiostrongylus costaricensis]
MIETPKSTHFKNVDQLLCLSQLFINVNMIGCVYSDAVMEKVRRMGSGIMEKVGVTDVCYMYEFDSNLTFHIAYIYVAVNIFLSSLTLHNNFYSVSAFYRFKQPNIDWTECAVNAIVETFLHGENIMVKGWSQKVDIRIGDLLASTRVLSKGECVRAKLDNAIDEMCAKISEIIVHGSSNINHSFIGFQSKLRFVR